MNKSEKIEYFYKNKNKIDISEFLKFEQELSLENLSINDIYKLLYLQVYLGEFCMWFNVESSEDSLEFITQASQNANLFAIQNSWLYFSRKGFFADSETKGVSFTDTFKGKNIKHVTGFNLSHRTWKVIFEDDSWILAFDQGNGNYFSLTDFNSFKIN